MRGLIDLVDRLLHARRRRRAVEALGAPLPPGTVLFMCYGNICRSPFAAALFRREFEREGGTRGYQARAVRSAGFTGADRSPPPEAIVAAAKFGLDISAHRSNLITADVYRAAALVVTMSPDQARDLHARFGVLNETTIVLADLDPQASESRTIRDPWRCAPEVYDESYARIDRCVRALISAIDGVP
jgi:protein-tyrosine phosphatase